MRHFVSTARLSHRGLTNTEKNVVRGGGRVTLSLVFNPVARNSVAPASILYSLMAGRHDLGTPDEILPRFGPPSTSQDLVRFPELGAGGTGGLALPRFTVAKADHRIRFAALRGTSLVAPDTTCRTGLVG